MLDNIKHVHFIGIGGAGMSALAYVLIKRGYHITGSDLKAGYMGNKLSKEGAVIFIGHAACQVEGAEVVVVSTAISENNIELQEARKRHIPVLHRSDILAYLINKQKGVTVAGAHGKTTTSSMLACICAEGNIDPTVVIGGIVASLDGNALNGKGDIVVAEADESDGSFLKFYPNIAIITNIENDHLDHYGSEEKILEAFEQYVSQITPGGKAILCYDNEKVRALGAKTDKDVISYAIKDDKADYVAKNIKFNHSGTDFEVYYRDSYLALVHLIVPGLHNVLNALGAIAAAQVIGVDLNSTIKSLSTFCGAKRRFETKGRVNGVWIVDDYAHHPTEIMVTLKAAKQTEHKRLICVFQPHRYTRTKLLLKDFAVAFKDCDELILTDIYAASENPIEGITGEYLAEEVKKATGQKVTFISKLDDIEKYLENHVQAGDLVMTVGAGDVYTVGEKLLERLNEGSKEK